MVINNWIDGLKTTFKKRAPHISELNIDFSESLNDYDHVAFRCLGWWPFKISILEKNFLKMGYYAAEDYNFEEKKLRARCYFHPTSKLKRIFLSEPKFEFFSDDIKSLIHNLVDKVPESHCNSPSIFFNPNPWRTQISLEDYHLVQKESEYISWVLVNGSIPNHFTFEIPPTNNMEVLMNNIKLFGFDINTSGGLIKGKGTDLEQASTMADKTDYLFYDMNEPQKVPSCFYEFAKRKNGFNGFVANNADKIFDSTNEY